VAETDHMTTPIRKITAWGLIVAGLSGLLGGAGMAYIFWVGHETAVQSARAQERMNPFGHMAGPPRKSALIGPYGAAALSVAIGGLLTYLGMRLRRERDTDGRTDWQSVPRLSTGEGQPNRSVRKRYQALGVCAGGGEEKVLKVFDELVEAQAFAKFMERGGAFVEVRIEAMAAPRKKVTEAEDFRRIHRPGGFAKLLFAVGLLLGLGGGGALGTFAALRLELQGRLFVYCICGFTVAGALPAYWVMNKLYGARKY
jgi:hypothetical protein